MKELTCIVCPNGCSLKVEADEKGGWIVTGNLCPKGKNFAICEITNPVRSISSTVKTTVKGIPRLPVRTEGDIPLKKIPDAMREINSIVINKPVHRGDIVIKNVAMSSINVIATSDMYYLMGDD